MKNRIAIISMLVLMISLMACSSDNANQSDSSSAGEVADSGGPSELIVAYDTVPPSFDPHMSPTVATMDIARPVFEPLIAIDSSYEPQPMLAESWEVNDDNTQFTFHLREGVKFHNGDEMTAEDVVASLNRWIEISPLGLENFGDASIEIESDYTVVLELDEPSSVALLTIGNPMQFAAVMPKEIIDDASPEGVNDYIGTGPYRVEEWVPNQHLKVSKFENYQPLSDPSDGLAGKKEALVDEIQIEFVTDPSTRVSGIQTGQYDVATLLPYDNEEQLEADANVNTYVFEYGFDAFFFNQQEGLFSDPLAREAVLAALNMEEIAMAAYTDERFYNLNHSFAVEDQTNWHNEAGQDLYYEQDTERATQLLEEAGYDGEEIVFIVSRAYETHYNAAIAVQQQLEAIGMNVKLEVYDWGALLEHRENPEVYDIFATGFPTEANPANYRFFNSRNDYPGSSENETMDQLLDDIRTSSSQEEATEIFAEFQEEYYNHLPAIKYSDHSTYHSSSENVEGLDFFGGGIILWNVSNQ